MNIYVLSSSCLESAAAARAFSPSTPRNMYRLFCDHWLGTQSVIRVVTGAAAAEIKKVLQTERLVVKKGSTATGLS